MQRQHAVHMLRFLGATMTGRMRKSVALETLAAVFAARRIQRWYRRLTQVNERCPISLERVRYPYVSVRTTRLAFVRYNMHPFHEYLCAQTGGVVREPTTNTAISPRTQALPIARFSGTTMSSTNGRRPSRSRFWVSVWRSSSDLCERTRFISASTSGLCAGLSASLQSAFSSSSDFATGMTW
jgi:hypothetical protein